MPTTTARARRLKPLPPLPSPRSALAPMFSVVLLAVAATWAGYPGSLGHETTDAQSFAAWGADVVHRRGDGRRRPRRAVDLRRQRQPAMDAGMTRPRGRTRHHRP